MGVINIMDTIVQRHISVVESNMDLVALLFIHGKKKLYQ